MRAIPVSPTRPYVEPRVPTSLAVLAVLALGLGFGIHVAITVDSARPDDGAMARLLPWLMYPGAVAIIAVRTRAEMLITGLAVVVPVAAFATLYDRIAEMAIVVPLWYAALLLVGISSASYCARRRGPVWALAAVLAGVGAVIGFAVVSLALLSLWPMTRAPRT